jgi:hypothetical protein
MQNLRLRLASASSARVASNAVLNSCSDFRDFTAGVAPCTKKVNTEGNEYSNKNNLMQSLDGHAFLNLLDDFDLFAAMWAIHQQALHPHSKLALRQMTAQTSESVRRQHQQVQSQYMVNAAQQACLGQSTEDYG